MRSPPGLASLQREFLAALSAREARIPAGLRGGRFEAYRRNAAANWRAALADAYPVVERLVGPAFFGESAARYSEAHPSRSGDLHRFGAEFPGFIERYAPARELAYLGDVARLEWARHLACFAAEPPPFDFEALARVAPDAHGELHLHLHPAAALLRSPHAVVAIWEANQPERDGTPDRSEGPDFVLVSRKHLEVRIACIDAGAWGFLAAIQAGETLAASARHFGDGLEERLAPALQEFVACGVIAGFMAPG